MWRIFVKLACHSALRSQRLTLVDGDNRVEMMTKSVSKIQIGQLWKKDGTADTYLVTRVYSEALSTMATLRKSGSETEALVRVKVERTGGRTDVGGVFLPRRRMRGSEKKKYKSIRVMSYKWHFFAGRNCSVFLCS